MKRRSQREQVYARQGGRKVHVVAPGPFYAGSAHGACGADLWGDEYLAHMVPDADRCRKPACVALWPAHLRAVPS